MINLARERQEERYDEVPFLTIRRAYIDVLRAGQRKHMIHGLVELDVTCARTRIERHDVETGEHLSFTAFIAHCVAAAVDEHRIVQAYRSRGRLIMFHDVDVNLQVEAALDDQPVVKSIIVREANRKSVAEITDEIRRAEREGSDERRYRGIAAFVRVPGPLRTLAWRAIMRRPVLVKRFGGTVGLSSVGMFGAAGGWGIPIAPPTLMVTVGGIAKKPRFVDGELCERELLGVTLSFDHDVVDGAPATRFSRRLAELVESAYGLAPGTPV